MSEDRSFVSQHKALLWAGSLILVLILVAVVFAISGVPKVLQSDSSRDMANLQEKIREDMRRFLKRVEKVHREEWVRDRKRLKWRVRLGIVYPPAVGAGGTIYVGSKTREGGGKLNAVNPTGEIKWQLPLGFVEGTPAISRDGTIYAGSHDCNLYAVSPAGQVQWQVRTQGEIHSSPAIASDGTVYFGSKDGHVYAVSQEGAIRWKVKTGGPVASSPAIASDGTVYVGSADGQVYALSPDGSVKWTAKTGEEVESSPALGPDGTIYCVVETLYAISPEGKVKWKKLPVCHQTKPAVGRDGVVYVTALREPTTGLHSLYALSPAGEVKWEIELHDGLIQYSPAVGPGGKVYHGDYGGCIRAISPSGRIRWKADLGLPVYSAPAMTKGDMLYVGSYRWLYAIDGRPDSNTGAQANGAGRLREGPL